MICCISPLIFSKWVQTMWIWHSSLTNTLCHLSEDLGTSFRGWQVMPDGPLGLCLTKDRREKNWRLRESMRQVGETGEQYFERSWERRKETAERYFSSPPQLWNLTSGSMWPRLMPGCQATVALPHRREMLFLECHGTLRTFRPTPLILLFPSPFPSSLHSSLSLALTLCLSFPAVCQHKPPKPQQLHCWRAEINREGLTWSDLSTATPVHSLWWSRPGPGSSQEPSLGKVKERDKRGQIYH